MSPEDKVFALLAMIAEQSGEKVSQTRLEFTVRKILPYGPESVTVALESILMSSRRFPTVMEIESILGLSPASPEDKGREAAERIWGGISKHGSQVTTDGMDRVTEFLGPVAWEVVRLQGGWNQICDIATYDNGPTLKAQWRELATVLVRKGGLGAPPDWDTPLPEGAVFSQLLKIEDRKK